MSLTHRAACNRVAEYLMRSLKWCDLAVVEVKGRAIPFAEGHLSPNTQEGRDDFCGWYDRRRDWRANPASGGGQLDVLALTLPDWKAKRKVKPRIAIVEVKVSRSDLLSDLRAGKLLRYEPQATHVYLAITDETMLVPWAPWDPQGATSAAWLADLGAKGLPTHWGVLRVPESHVGAVHSLRQPGRNPHACEPAPELRTSLALKAAVSMAHRMARE